MRVIGLISGTSHDGVDGCHVEFEQSGTRIEATIVGSDVVPYPPELRERIAEALPPNPTTVAEICALDVLIGEHFARVAMDLDADGCDRSPSRPAARSLPTIERPTSPPAARAPRSSRPSTCCSSPNDHAVPRSTSAASPT